MTFHLALVLLLIAICLGAAGQVLIKWGLTQLGQSPSPGVVVASLFRSAYVAGGFGCYALSSILYLLAVSKLPLSYAYPMVALSYVLVTVATWRVLNESLPALRIAGLVVVMLGVLVVALSYRGDSPRDALPSQTVQTQASGQPGR